MLKKIKKIRHHFHIKKKYFKWLFLAISAIVILAELFFLIKANPLIAGIFDKKITSKEILVEITPTPALGISQVIDEINKKRLEENLAILIKNSTLDNAAEEKAHDLIDKNYWDNNAPDGTSPWVYVTKSGYSYQDAGMLLGKGYLTAEDVVNGWMTSSYKNDLLASKYKDIGVGIKEGTIQGENTKVVVVYLASKKVNNTYTNTNTQNSGDPIITCKIHEDCGGGTQQLKQSVCRNSTCCQIGSSWIFYLDKNKCSVDQKANSQTPNQNNIPSQNTQKSSGNNYYCWNNAYGYAYYTSSGDQCNSDNASSTGYKICMDTQKIKANSCDSACKAELDHDKAACVWAYTGSNPGIESSSAKYGECLNGPGGASETYGNCLAKCTDQYTQDIQQCK